MISSDSRSWRGIGKLFQRRCLKRRLAIMYSQWLLAKQYGLMGAILRLTSGTVAGFAQKNDEKSALYRYSRICRPTARYDDSLISHPNSPF